MQPNIDIPERYIRLVTGVLALGACSQLRPEANTARAITASFGAMKIAEGITGWCPILHALGVRSMEQGAETTGTSRRTQSESTTSQRSSEHHRSESHMDRRDYASHSSDRNDRHSTHGHGSMHNH